MTFDWLLTRGLPEEAPKIEKNGALIYVRVSDRKQVKNGSLETQKEACSRHCQENGFEIIDVIEDAGYSGTAGDRPGIMRMIELIKDRHDEIGYVITHVMDRASRQTDQWVVFRNALSKYDVVMVSVSERIDTSTEAGTAMADRQVALAAVERLSIIRRTHEGTVSARTRGCPTYPAPLGYSNAKLAGIGATFLREEPTWEVSIASDIGQRS